MRVYDCDNQEEFAQIENLINDKDLIINNLIQAFAPDNNGKSWSSLGRK